MQTLEAWQAGVAGTAGKKSNQVLQAWRAGIAGMAAGIALMSVSHCWRALQLRQACISDKQ
jgi:hypothetical protein